MSEAETSREKCSEVEISRGKCSEVEISREKWSEVEISREKYSEVEISREKYSEVEISREKGLLRSLAVPLGGCAKACVRFFLARCARGGCKWSETELALIYVRSLCRWAVS